MDVHVRVDIDEDGPVVVKTASGSTVDRLRREHDRLVRAVHPGVVALARRQPAPAGSSAGEGGEGDSYTLHIRYAGEPVSRWTGTVSGVAGLGAAVAGTLADLHALGVVHGRIDSSHILIGDDSRPRLCGLSQDGDATPADDVAALGAVLGDLLERVPAVRWRRPRGAAGATRALRHVIERATDPVPTRRPSAGVLADAILDAIPGADLPAPIGSTGDGDGPDLGPRRGRPGAGGALAAAAAQDRATASQPDTLDRIWSFAGEQSDDERWAAAFGSGPRDLPVGGVPSRAPAAASGRRRWAGGDGPGLDRDDDPPLPIAPVDTPGWATTSGRADDPGPEEPRWVPRRRGRDTTGDLDVGPVDDLVERLEPRDVRGDPGTDDLVERLELLDVRGDPGTDDLVERLEPRDVLGDPGTDDLVDHGARLRDDVAGEPPTRRRGSGEADDDLSTRDHRVPVPRVTRPRAVDDPDAPSRARRLIVVAALATATCLAAAGAVIVWTQGDDGPGTPAETEASAAVADCPATLPPAADVDGDGCAEALVVEGSTVDAGTARWTLGEPGDVVAVGDWDCDGEASAALFRPSTGDVFFFSAWAPSDEPVTVGASQRVVGGVGLRAQPDGEGCDHLVVERADGTTTTVEVTG